jgi:hypothetical protein
MQAQMASLEPGLVLQVKISPDGSNTVSSPGRISEKLFPTHRRGYRKSSALINVDAVAFRRDR